MSAKVEAIGHRNRFRDPVVKEESSAEKKEIPMPVAQVETPKPESVKDSTSSASKSKMVKRGAPKRFPNVDNADLSHISFKIPKEMLKVIKKVARQKGYNVTSDYIRDLIEKDVKEHLEQERQNIMETLNYLND